MSTETMNQEDLLQKTRQRAFMFALQQLSKHKDIDAEESHALINHDAIRGMVFNGITGWCQNKEQAYSLIVTELKQSLEQSRKKIQTIKEDFQPSWMDKYDDNPFRMPPKAISKLDEIDVTLQELLDDCKTIEKRGS